MRGPSCSGSIYSIAWLLMPWFLASPRYQHPWFWLCKIAKFLSYFRKDFDYLCHDRVEECYRLKPHFDISYGKFSTLSVNTKRMGIINPFICMTQHHSSAMRKAFCTVLFLMILGWHGMVRYCYVMVRYITSMLIVLALSWILKCQIWIIQ